MEPPERLPRDPNVPHTNRKLPYNGPQQPYQQHQQSGAGGRRKNYPPGTRTPQHLKRRQPPGKKRGPSAVTELGFFGSVPSLNDLHRDNRKKTRRHYQTQPPSHPYPHQHHPHHPSKGSNRPFIYKNPSPRHLLNTTTTAPNDNIFPPTIPTTGRFAGPPPHTTPRSNPLATPTVDAAHADTGDKLELAEGLHGGLDFFATNEGLVIYAPSSSEDAEVGSDGSRSVSVGSDDEDDDEDGDGVRHRRRHRSGGGGGFDGKAAAGSTLAGSGGGGGGDDADFGAAGATGNGLPRKIIRRLRTQVAQQDAYIAELEDDNLRYQERLEVALQQLGELQEKRIGARARGGDGIDDQVHQGRKDEDKSEEDNEERGGAAMTVEDDRDIAPVPTEQVKSSD